MILVSKFNLSRREIILAVLAFSVRIVAVIVLLLLSRSLSFPYPVGGDDAPNYIELARNLSEHGVFSRTAHAPFIPESFRTPGYPFIIALLLALTKTIYAIPVIHAFIAALSTIIVYRMGFRLFNKRVGLYAALLFIFDPIGIYLSSVVLSETFFVFFFLLGVYTALILAKEHPHIFFLSGALFGIATLIRPVAQFMPLLFALLWLFMWGREFFTKRRFIHIALFILGFFLIVFPWALRNKIAAHSWNLSLVGVHNFFWYHIPSYMAAKENITDKAAREIMWNRLLERSPQAQKYLTVSESSDITKISLEFISKDPIGFGIFYIVKTTPFFISDGISDIAREMNIPSRKSDNLSTLLFKGDIRGIFRSLSRDDSATALYVVVVLFWALVTIGMIGTVVVEAMQNNRERRLIVLFFFALILLMAILSGPVSNARIRYPVTPFIYIVFMLGVDQFFQRTNFLREKDGLTY